MNKLLTKIATSFVGIAMAIGVGVAVGISGQEAVPVSAASATWNKITSNPVSGTNYLILSSDGTKYFDASVATIDSTSNPVAITVSNNSVTGDYDGKAWTFTKSGDNWYISRTLNNTTTYIGRTANSNGINTGSSGIANTITNSSGAFTIKGTGSGSSKQMSYNSSSGRFRYFASGTVMLFEKAVTPQTITVDPASKEAYTDETISLTTSATSASWALSNNTCGASLSAASGKTVTVSATGAGSVRVTATATGYTSPYVDLTFSERPTSPYITPEKSSTSGYTGQNESISFSYGNLTGSLSVTSSNTSVVTVETPSYSAGEGTVQFNFVGAGSTTVKFYDGSTELASVSVSVTASSVTITGLASTGSVYVGKTSDLSTGVTVTAVGSYSNAVTWASDATSVATVSSAGVVTGVSEGTAHISVTSVDYPSATMSCTVTVSEAPLEYEVVFGTAEGTSGITNFSNTSYVIPSGVTLNNIQGNVYSNTSNQAASLRFGKSGTTGSFDATISGNYYITSVKCNLKYYGSDTTATFAVTPSGGSAISKSLTASWEDYTYDVSAAKAKTVTLGTDVNGKRAYLSGFTITYAAQKTLSNIALSGSYPTTFFKGDTFSHSGMVVTANYSDSTSDVVTSNATWSTPDMSTVGNKTITVSYSDAYGSASKTYTITVSYADVTSVTLSQNTAEIGLGEVFNHKLVVVTVSPANADQSVVWTDVANTVGDDYLFDDSGLLSGDTAGTITLRCSSTADSTKYADLVVTVTADPTAEFTPASVSGYVGKSDDIAFTYGNMSDTSLISITSSNSSIVEVDEFVADEGEGLVTVNFVAEGNATLSVSYNGGSTLDTVDVTVSADSVTSVTWSASNIDVFSGDTLSTTGWNVQYEMASGDTGSAANYTIKLGSATVTAGYSFVAADNGKTMHVEYGGVSSSSINVVVTQRINDVYADIIDETEWSHELTAKTWSAEGDQTINGKSWTVSGEDDGTGYAGWDATKGQQFGSGSHPYESLTLSSSDFTGTVSTIKITTSGANSINATVSVSVGGTAFKSSGNESVSISSTSTEYTFTGVGSGTITISWANSSSKAIYFKALGVTTQTSSGTTQIANNASHKAAQRVAVKFAKAFNAAMDETENCTTGLSSAWSTCSSAYNTFKSEAAALGSAEEEYAKNLIKYATAEYSDDSGEACIERMMKTYEICVQKHGQTAFMSELKTVNLSTLNPIATIGVKNNTALIVVIVSLISIAAVSGYFFLRKRKED